MKAWLKQKGVDVDQQTLGEHVVRRQSARARRFVGPGLRFARLVAVAVGEVGRSAAHLCMMLARDIRANYIFWRANVRANFYLSERGNPTLP
jgi:hypothetical protein